MPPLDILWVLIAPDDNSDAGFFFAFWAGLYVFINLGWDILTPKTPRFHLSHLDSKVGTLWNGVTFASSIMVVSSAFSPATRDFAGDQVAPLLLAGTAGLFVTLSAICPYKPRKQREI
jgi:hypothetical protein